MPTIRYRSYTDLIAIKYRNKRVWLFDQWPCIVTLGVMYDGAAERRNEREKIKTRPELIALGSFTEQQDSLCLSHICHQNAYFLVFFL